MVRHAQHAVADDADRHAVPPGYLVDLVLHRTSVGIDEDAHAHRCRLGPGRKGLALWRGGGGPARRFCLAASRGLPCTGSMRTPPSPSGSPSSVRFSAAANLPAAGRGISNIVSLAAMRIAPTSVLVM